MRHAVRRWWVSSCAAAALLGATPAAYPQEAVARPTFALNQLEPSVPGDRFFGVPSATTTGHLELRGTLMFDLAYQPLVLRGPGGEERGGVVSHQAFLRGDVSLAVADRFLFWIGLPVAVTQGGDDPVTASGATLASPQTAELGDIRVGGRARIVGGVDDPLQLAAGLHALFPSAGTGSWAGEGAVRFVPHAVLGGRYELFAYSVTVGGAFTTADNAQRVTYGAGVAAVLGEDELLQIGPEFYAATGVGDDGVLLESPDGAVAYDGSTNAEVLFGAKLRALRFLVFGLAGGPGLTSVPGTPVFRTVASVSYDPLPEAKGTEPTEASPSGDADGDGIVDDADACPEERGISTGDAATNGCPLPDADDDGVPDSSDACPQVSGVASTDPKRNGCPRDGDGDSVADVVDACPDERGSPSPDANRNGCPVGEDGDADGVSDAVDACPKEKGSADEKRELNGCPHVKLTDKEIVILKQIQFHFGRAQISQTVDPVSNDLLTEVRDVIEKHPEIEEIEVQGHTDNVGPEPYNRRLSQERAEAVRMWLINNGIGSHKLRPKGYGPAQPVAPNATAEGRQRNRRVQFLIIRRSTVAPRR